MEFSSGSGVRTLVLTPLRILRFANFAKLKIEARDRTLARTGPQRTPSLAPSGGNPSISQIFRQKKRVLNAPLKIIHGIAVNDRIANR